MRNLTRRNFYLLQAGQCFNGFPGKLDIDVPVGRPVALLKHGPVRHGVEERPEGGIAAAVVIQLEVLGESRSS